MNRLPPLSPPPSPPAGSCSWARDDFYSFLYPALGPWADEQNTFLNSRVESFGHSLDKNEVLSCPQWPLEDGRVLGFFPGKGPNEPKGKSLWFRSKFKFPGMAGPGTCLLYTSDAADDWLVV